MRASAKATLGAEGKVVIGMVGNLLPVKNYGVALQAFSELPSHVRSQARLDIFGAGPLDATLKQQAAGLGLASEIVFHGFQADIQRILLAFDLFLSTSLRESAPLSYLEAMNAAIPIVATPSMGTLDIVEDGATGIIVNSWEPNDIVRALERAISDPAWRRAAGLKSWERLKKDYDIELVADRHVELYQRLLKGTA